MKVISKKTFRKRNLLVLMPLVFMFLLLVAMSAPVAVADHYSPSYNVPPPGPFPPAPQPPNYTGYVDIAELLGPDYLGAPANQGSVHILDVRSSFEYLADVCPMQIALGMPTYPTTNTGHPTWNWADPTDATPTVDAQYEEAYAIPYWIGFYFAGSPGVPNNIRMEENPNFHDYFMGLIADGEISGAGPNDKLVILCQTGYRASFAAMEIQAMNMGYGLGFEEVVVLYGGELAWQDDWSLDDSPLDANCDANDPADPSPDDDPANPNMPPYMTPVPWPNSPTWKDCDPDDVPGPAALGKSNVLAAPWAYDTARLALVAAPTIWNGTEPHVAAKPWWMSGMGADDSALSLSHYNTFWASYADYLAAELSVTYKLTNNEPLDVTPTWSGGESPWDILPEPYWRNYAAGCTGYGAPGSGCEPVGQAAHGTAYNTMVVNSTATNGVTVVPAGPPLAMVGNIAANGTANATLKYNIPLGVNYFTATVYAISTDLPDPTATYPMGFNDPFHTPMMCPIFGTCAAPWPATGMGWYGIYQYPGPA